jgi:hypothetical protein
MPAKADECVTVRLPAGVKDQLRAATGQPVSRYLRLLAMATLEQRKAQRRPTAYEDAQTAVAAVDPQELKE